MRKERKKQTKKKVDARLLVKMYNVKKCMQNHTRRQIKQERKEKKRKEKKKIILFYFILFFFC